MPLLNENLIKVTYHLDGKTENINLPRLTLRQLMRWCFHIGERDMPALVAFCASKPIEWVDTLTDESFAELCEACQKANFQRAMVQLKRNPIIAAQIGPVLMSIRNVMEMASPGSSLSEKSTEQPPSESAAETSSVSLTSPPTVSSESSAPAAA